MDDKSDRYADRRSRHRRRGGSIVFPLLLIVLGILLLLDNLNVVPVDWGYVVQFWPVILIALGLEVILGRRLSAGSIILVVFLLLVGGGVLWWSVANGSGNVRSTQFTWPDAGVERAQIEINLPVGELWLHGGSDLGDLLLADMQMSPGVQLDQNVHVSNGVAQGRIDTNGDFFDWPRIFGGKSNEWDLTLNDRVGWDLSVDHGVGDLRLDLSDLQLRNLNLSAGVGTVDVTLPRRGGGSVTIDGGIGDLSVRVPEGTQVRLQVDRGLSRLSVSSRFTRQGDVYETEGLSTAESFVDLVLKVGIGNVTVQ
jgi:hypothetical protein